MHILKNSLYKKVVGLKITHEITVVREQLSIVAADSRRILRNALWVISFIFTVLVN